MAVEKIFVDNKEFVPIKKGVVSMYHCGPTVYNRAHIGNLRAYIFADIIKRTFKHCGYKVNQVINITDVGHLVSDADDGEDKIEKEARKTGEQASDISKKFTDLFIKDLRLLHTDISDTIFPKATEHIAEQIELIKTLEEKGYTYTISDGLYFDTRKYSEYGALGGIAKIIADGETTNESRIGENSEKRNPQDFALWKFSEKYSSSLLDNGDIQKNSQKDGPKRQQEWPSPWGIGFPGWHIECSAMSMKYLGEVFDIHTGGIDHIPVHHNNEIAQSVCATEKEFVHYWMHVNFVMIEGQKMSKSLQNDYSLDDLLNKFNITPLAYKYLVLNAHYSSLINITKESLEGASIALEKLHNIYKERKLGFFNFFKPDINPFIESFRKIVANDFDTPKAIAHLWTYLKEENDYEKKVSAIKYFDDFFALGITSNIKSSAQPIPTNITELAKERELARKDKNWQKADEIRVEIEKAGYAIKDTDSSPTGFEIKRTGV